MTGWGKLWVLGMMAYAGARAVAVGQTLPSYGVNPWIFFVLDVGSALPLGVGQVRLVEALRAKDAARVQRWLMVLVAAFSAPYAYLVIGSDRPLPPIAYWILGGLFGAVALATVERVRRETRRA